MARDLTELNKLEEYLKEHNIPYERKDSDDLYGNRGRIPDAFIPDRHQIVVPNREKYLWDAICHYGSYGCGQGLLEIMGSLVDQEKEHDTVVGWLTADDVISLIEGSLSCAPD